jgi:hypothetical protein
VTSPTVLELAVSTFRDAPPETSWLFDRALLVSPNTYGISQALLEQTGGVDAAARH